MLDFEEEKMAAMFLAKRGITNINRTRIVSYGVTSRYLGSQGDGEREKSKEEGTSKTMNHVADTAKDELERNTDAAAEESGDVGKPGKSVENDEENVAVGENGTVKGENQSSG